MESQHLKSVIVRVTDDGQEVTTKAFGESQTGVPATADMHFRNGSVAIAYVAAVLLQLVDEKAVALDDIIATWVPQIPNSDRVTLRQLATMTSGYQDYVLGNDAFETGTGVHAAAVIKALNRGDNYLANRVYSGVPADDFGLEQKIAVEPTTWAEEGTLFQIEINFAPNQSAFTEQQYADEKREMIRQH